MKKIYKNPEMNVVKIHTQQMIAVSMPIGGETEVVESREFDYDYDDEEE